LSDQAVMKSLKEIQDRLNRIENIIKEPKDAVKSANWWKAEYINAARGYRGITLTMALATAGSQCFDTVEQWRCACSTDPAHKISRSDFYLLRKKLKESGLLDGKMRALTTRGKKAGEAIAKYPFPIVSEKHFRHIIESVSDAQ